MALTKLNHLLDINAFSISQPANVNVCISELPITNSERSIPAGILALIPRGSAKVARMTGGLSKGFIGYINEFFASACDGKAKANAPIVIIKTPAPISLLIIVHRIAFLANYFQDFHLLLTLFRFFVFRLLFRRIF